MAEWLIALLLKSRDGNTSVGSTPTFSAIYFESMKAVDRHFRGPVPLTQSDFDELEQNNVSVILNLERGYLEFFHKRINVEFQEAVKRDIAPLHLQLGDFIAPTLDELEAAVAVLENPNYGTVYIHCLHGVDRTGMVCAAYRMKVNGWSFQQAKEEMFANGFHKLPYLYIGWLRVLLKYAAKLGK